MRERRVDLHAHTTASDGTATPAELVALAAARGLAAVAVTDHDTVAGVAAAEAAARGLGVEVVAGVELSVEGARGEIHLLGYFVDVTDEAFLMVINTARDARGPRNAAIVDRLRALGHDVTIAEVEAEAAKGAVKGKSVGRPHIAAVLVQKGIVPDVRAAFDEYLAEGKPAYVPRLRLTPQEAINAIRGASGVAVLAHPFTIPADVRRATVESLARDGLQGIEVIYPKHDAALRERLTALAKEFDLVETGGSDYHGGHKPDIELGTGRDGNVRVPASVLDAVRARRR